MKLVINTDGGSRGNPGPAGIGIAIANAEGEYIFQHGSQIGVATNNVAEYRALIKALEAAQDLGGSELLIRMDSELIVKQMKGLYKIKEPSLQGLAQEVLVLLKKFSSATFTHIPREQNKLADKLVNDALDGKL
jgi:ribonuclease HI